MTAELPEFPQNWPEPWRSLFEERVRELEASEHLVHEIARAEVEVEIRAEFAAIVRRNDREESETWQ